MRIETYVSIFAAAVALLAVYFSYKSIEVSKILAETTTLQNSTAVRGAACQARADFYALYPEDTNSVNAAGEYFNATQELSLCLVHQEKESLKRCLATFKEKYTKALGETNLHTLLC